MVVVRTGVNANHSPDTRSTVFTADPGEFEHEFFRILMRAVKDQAVPDPGPFRHSGVVADADPHDGILRSAQQPEDFQAASPVVAPLNRAAHGAASTIRSVCGHSTRR
jgi:hypothetical protein